MTRLRNGIVISFPGGTCTHHTTTVSPAHSAASEASPLQRRVRRPLLRRDSSVPIRRYAVGFGADNQNYRLEAMDGACLQGSLSSVDEARGMPEYFVAVDEFR